MGQFGRDLDAMDRLWGSLSGNYTNVHGFFL